MPPPLPLSRWVWKGVTMPLRLGRADYEADCAGGERRDGYTRKATLPRARQQARNEHSVTDMKARVPA